jgi:hypothetical protein
MTTDVVAYVTRRNGAWMVQFTGNAPSDWPENDQFDCASALHVAKRLAKEGARTYATHLKWEERDSVGGWVLLGLEQDFTD